MRRWIVWVGVGVLAVTLPLAAQGKTTDEERRIGKEAAEQLAKDKSIKWVTDPAMVERVERIGKTVAAAADEPDLTYTFKIIDTHEVNAFSIPGGYIYINKGLIERCESDDELAGVIAHEIAHAAKHHVRQLLSQQKKMTWATLAAILVGAAVKADVGHAAVLSQSLAMARVNGYGIKFETEADHFAVEYLSKTPYNAVGVLTFMERLARDDAWKGGRNIDLGIFQTHPYPEERSQALINHLNKKQIPIDRRKVMASLRVTTKEVKTGDQAAGEVRLGNALIATVAGEGNVTAMERAQAVAARLDAVLDKKLGSQDIRVGPDRHSVWARKTLLITLTPEDAKLLGKSEEEIARQIEKSLKTSLWKQTYNSIF